MTYTETISIPQNSRGFFLRERDAINSEFKLNMTFPRGRDHMHGNYQDMVITASGPSTVRKAMPKIREILVRADTQYHEFCDRRDTRKSRVGNYNKPKAPTANEVTSTVVKKTKNPFDVLDGLFEQEEEQRKVDAVYKAAIASQLAEEQSELDAIATGKAPKTVVPNITHMNFAAAISKPAPQKVRINVVQPTLNWADMDDDDDESWFNK